MAAPTSAVSICNLALSYLKQESIADLADDNDRAKTCLKWYDQTRRFMLRGHVWNFALKRAQLTTSGTPAFGYDNQYDLPNDYIRIASIGDEDNGFHTPNGPSPYELEDGKILINSSAATLNLRYICDVTTVAKFDPMFVQSMAISLALNMAYAFSGSLTNVKTIKALFDSAFPWATSVDGQERPPSRIQRSRFKQARTGRQSSVAGPKTVFY